MKRGRWSTSCKRKHVETLKAPERGVFIMACGKGDPYQRRE